MSAGIEVAAVMIAFFAAYTMTRSRTYWKSVVGILLGMALVIGLSMDVGYHIGLDTHTCEPPPIEVYL